MVRTGAGLALGLGSVPILGRCSCDCECGAAMVRDAALMVRLRGTAPAACVPACTSAAPSARAILRGALEEDGDGSVLGGGGAHWVRAEGGPRSLAVFVAEAESGGALVLADARRVVLAEAL